jgi:hypothetical protein
VQQNIQVLFEFPNTDGTAGQVLQTDGYANLSFATVGGGGKVLQVVSTTKTDTFSSSTTSPSFADVTGLSVSITPSSASNKILVLAHYNVGASSLDFCYGRLMRNSTAIFSGDASAGHLLCTQQGYENDTNNGTCSSLDLSFLDSPSTTSSTTYKIQVNTTGATVYVNRSGRDTAATTSDGRFASSITVMEIAG